jgi:pantoate--beta-alanine ligase
MSSRNIYLSEKHRKNSPLLHSTLQHAAQRLREGDVPKSVMASAKRALTKGGFKVDYVEARNSQTLAKLGPKQNEPIRLLAAAQLGKTRLIDNIAV